MTPILFLAGFSLGILLTVFRHPMFGLYTYFFVFYMTPADVWWRNVVPDLRYLLIAAVVTLVMTIPMASDPDREPWYKTTPAKLFMLLIGYTWLQMLWAINPNVQYELAFLLTKHLLVFYLIYKLADSPEKIKQIAIIHVVGCAWFGYQALGAGGGRLETIGGAVASSNKLGVHIATGMLFGGLLFLGLRGAWRWLIVACMPLVANTLVLTVSRGAFLGFFSGGIVGYFAIPTKYRKGYVLCGVLGIVLVGMLAHNSLIERFTDTFAALTGQQQELDRSATSRLEIARAGIAIGLDHPFGAGAKATERLSGPYITGWDRGRAAHNTVTEIFAEHGFPGLILYLLIILWAARTTLRIRDATSGSDDPERQEIGLLAAMMGASLATIYIAGNFSSNLELETQYWCLSMLASLAALERSLSDKQAAEQESRDESAVVGAGSPRLAGPAAARKPGYVRQNPSGRGSSAATR